VCALQLCSRGTLWHERQNQGGTLPVDQVSLAECEHLSAAVQSLFHQSVCLLPTSPWRFTCSNPATTSLPHPWTVADVTPASSLLRLGFLLLRLRFVSAASVCLLQVRRYAAELVSVLSHLHDHGVVYVDLKPENVLLQDCGHIMLCDMDLAHTQTEIDHIRELEAGASVLRGETRKEAIRSRGKQDKLWQHGASAGQPPLHSCQHDA
jgi:serine/threonine protein kinase